LKDERQAKRKRRKKNVSSVALGTRGRIGGTGIAMSMEKKGRNRSKERERLSCSVEGREEWR